VVVVALVLFLWTLLTAVSGGIALPYFSSRNPRNPALALVLLCGAAWVLGEPGRRPQLLHSDLRWTWRRIRGMGERAWLAWTQSAAWLESELPAATAPVCVLALCGAILVTSSRHTAFVAAGSDAYGYVSQAHMWATGTLRQPEPLMQELEGLLPREALAPLAYRPAPDAAAIVPVTSPGLPLLMAIFEMAAGPAAVFAVGPLLAALAVWATYLLGRVVCRPWTGVMAAVLLAASPAFLFQLTSSPMSDIPAAAFWTLSLVAAHRQTRWSGFASGSAAGAAILVRANLAPLVLVPAAMVLLRGPERRRALAAFAAGVVPSVVFIAALYTYWYGSPVNSGYGSLEQLYSLGNLWPNLTRYSTWLVSSQTPLVLVAATAPLLVDCRRAAALLAFAVAVLACYAFYIPFDAWWYLRFLLPAYPALMVLTAAAVGALARRLPAPVRLVTTLTLLIVVCGRTIDYAAARATFDTGGEQKYAITGRYVAEHLPANAVILSEQHSGSIRYYGHRTTVRFGSIPADHLDGALAGLQRLGYQPYLVVEDWEEDAFRRQFAGRRAVDALAAGPEYRLPLGNVRIYPLAR
jgi:hypothetical protein